MVGDISAICANRTTVTCGHVPVRVKRDKWSRGQTPKPCKPNFSRHEDHQAALVRGSKQKSKELLVPQLCSPKGWNKSTTYCPLRSTNEDYSLVHCSESVHLLHQ